MRWTRGTPSGLVLFQVEHVQQGRLKYSLRWYRFHSQSEGVFQQSVRIADAEAVLEFFRGLLRYNRERQKHSCPVLWLAARDLQPVVVEYLGSCCCWVIRSERWSSMPYVGLYFYFIGLQTTH